MNSMEYGIIVIDIGMTNKKVAVYDEHLVQQDAVYREYQPVMVRDPETGADISSHDLAGMESWFTGQIRNFAAKYPIRAVSVTTHGATFVCIDKAGKVCAPCIFYTYEPGESFQEDFYRVCGRAEDLQAKTYTPRFSAMINLAKGIRFLQTRFSSRFAQTDTILCFPQYWSFLLTGRRVYEPTYLACHTYLWDQNRHTWSDVVDSLGIRNKMPREAVSTCASLGTITPEAAEKLGLDPSVIVTAGIHDSNASLLPYLADQTSGDFILNSTGTWCVCMHPAFDTAANASYAPEDIGKVVFFNRSALDRPVKTAIFLGGMEVDTYVKLFQKINSVKTFPSSDEQTVQKLLREKTIFLLPEVVAGSGQYPGSTPGIFEGGKFYPLEGIKNRTSVPQILIDEKMLWAAVVISMVIQTETALRRTGLTDGTSVFTEGGFRKNSLYNALLACVLSRNSVCLTGMKEATAAGCAMSALMALTEKTHTELGQLIKIERIPVEPMAVTGYEAYKAAWLRFVMLCTDDLYHKRSSI